MNFDIRGNRLIGIFIRNGNVYLGLIKMINLSFVRIEDIITVYREKKVLRSSDTTGFD